MDNNIIKIDEENLKNDLKGVIRKTIEESLTEMYLAGVSVRRVHIFCHSKPVQQF